MKKRGPAALDSNENKGCGRAATYTLGAGVGVRGDITDMPFSLLL
jgi:hypothetical protein